MLRSPKRPKRCFRGSNNDSSSITCVALSRAPIIAVLTMGTPSTSRAIFKASTVTKRHLLPSSDLVSSKVCLVLITIIPSSFSPEVMSTTCLSLESRTTTTSGAIMPALLRIGFFALMRLKARTGAPLLSGPKLGKP